MRRADIKNIIEAILFSSTEPVGIEQLNIAINEELSPKEIEKMLTMLIDEYKDNNRGIQIIKVNDKYQMCSNEEFSDYIKNVVGNPKRRYLSQATLETLIIIAYKQPITKNELENIRGVKCDKVLKTLTDSELIFEAGRLNKTGKPIIYRTTDEFLKLLQIDSLEKLPSISTQV